MPFEWTIYVANPILAKTVFFKPGIIQVLFKFHIRVSISAALLCNILKNFFATYIIEFATKTTFLMDYFPEDSALMHFSGKDNVAIINGEHWKAQRKVKGKPLIIPVLPWKKHVVL